MTNVSASQLPRPTLEVVPAKRGLPEAGGSLDLLVKVGVERPKIEIDRKPLSLALVIDRSGSMSGAPLAGAKEAARLAVQMLLPGDWVSVVAFDDEVTVPQPLVKVGPDTSGIAAAIEAIEVAGSTNLFAGWAEGVTQVMACPQPGVVCRVVLLSDGRANAGVTDRGQITQDVAEAATHGVTTTALGLGAHYDEFLMRGVADAGRGNYVFLTDAPSMARAFEVELASLGSLRGHDVHLGAEPRTHATLSHANDDAASVAGLRRDADGVFLTDMISGMPAEYLLTLRLQPGRTDLALKLRWDDLLTGAPDEESYPIDLPWLAAAEWEALPVDGRVIEARVLANVVTLKQQVAQAMRAQDESGARARLEAIRSFVGSLPVGDERTREEAELAQLTEHIEHRAYAYAARYSDIKSRDRLQGRDDKRRNALVAAEQDKIARKRQLFEEAQRARQAAEFAQPPDPGVLFEATTSTGRIQVVRGDITAQAVDAVVNSTNRAMMGAAGVDGALARAGGARHVAAMRAIGGIDYGQAVFTPAFGIPATYVIHTAAQPWQGGRARELDVLRRCHEAAFALAQQLGAKSVAVPAIGTGVYAFPPEIAAPIAAAAAKAWLQKGAFELIRFVAFDDVIGTAYVNAVENW